MKISAKISAGFATIVILLILIGSFSLVGLARVSGINKNILEVVVPGVSESKDFQNASLETVVAVNSYLLTGNEDFIDSYDNYREESQARLNQSYEYAFTEEELTLIEELTTLSNEYNEFANEIISFKNSRRDDQAAETMVRRAAPKAEEISISG